jgi:ABC-type antimicrobial peptide transport system permease subunit
MTLMGLFAGAALLLTAIGLYGLLSYQVAQQTREIGVRMALGARRSHVLGRVVLRGLALTAAGLVLGIAASLQLTRFVATLLYGVNAKSMWVLAGVACLLLFVAALASLVPARRGTRVDPVIALRL